MTSKELRKILTERGHKYATLARKIGISPQALKNRIDAQEISCSTIEMLAEAMEVSPAYFYKDHPLTDAEAEKLRAKIKELTEILQKGIEALNR